MAEKKAMTPLEKRIQELIERSKGIPPGEVIRRLYSINSHGKMDGAKEFLELFHKYKKKADR